MRTWSRLLFLGSLGLGVLLGLLVSTGLQRALSPSPRPPEAEPAVQSRPAAARGDLEPEERHTIALFKGAQRSVAFITTQVEQVDFWTRNVFEVPSGTGSGFVWDEQGHVVTNFHVVQDSDSQKVTLGETQYDAKTVGVARDQDIAVLRIDAPPGKLA